MMLTDLVYVQYLLWYVVVISIKSLAGSCLDSDHYGFLFVRYSLSHRVAVATMATQTELFLIPFD
jgi:hypothetical protein